MKVVTVLINSVQQGEFVYSVYEHVITRQRIELKHYDDGIIEAGSLKQAITAILNDPLYVDVQNFKVYNRITKL